MSQCEVICQSQLRVWSTGTLFVVIKPWDMAGRIWSVLEEGEICWYEAASLRRDSVVLADSSPDEASSGK
jgi:hypothetical protein